MTCENKVQLEVETSTHPYSREVTVRCGWTVAFSPNDVGTVHCVEHSAEYATDVRCPRCGVGGFKEDQLPDHWLIDCG